MSWTGRRSGCAVVAAALLVGVAGCGDDPVVSVSPPTAATVTLTTTQTVTQSPTPPAVTSTPTTATPTSTATASATATAARWPKALGEPQQGQPVWAVYLAVGHSNTDAVIEKAVKNAAKVRYTAILGDVACDGGAMEGLHLDEYAYWTAASLYFGSEADARDFAASFTRAVAKPKGVVKVKVGCLD